ncbi:uncharacterized protein LOC129005664 [Macrosteles quadrilineatus]|uniref:uncharacterized protein LOC129005664 n=1 Tax=Macrosteles quadrilineatus TaxID=74068 RepID=UPI0023E2C585|nr:uncharacterized protein LOC129005664 [Macrosteles quadrilineatus]
MWSVRLHFAVLFVWASITLCYGATDPGRSGRRGSSLSSIQHFIYPRTGRLFHADYVRDNEIFRSLERTNFMRRGPFAERQGKVYDGKVEKKKHVYVRGGRIPVETEKSDLLKDTSRSNAVLFKVSKIVVKDPVLAGERIKRSADLDDRDMIQNSSAVGQKSPPMYLNNLGQTNGSSTDNKGSGHSEGGIPIITENKVDCDNNSTSKNNDTDKTLFVHDSAGRTPEVGEGSLMKKTVVDDSLKLYPVYRGVKYYYPQTQRRLVYSPQLTVSMDVPVVTEAEDEGNTTSGLQEEGRSRRPFKKLAFPLLLALKLKTAIMVPLVLGFIGLISFKGLWSGLTALAIAAALGLKALVTGGGARVLVHSLPPPPPPAHVHHLPPPAVEYAEYWSRRNDDHNTYSAYSDYRPSTWP